MASITGALILAAGKGTRMHSDKPKVLQSILGEPMLRFVHDALAPVFGDNVWTVIGHKADMVREAFKGEDRRFVVQEKQLGTGHALQAAWDELKAAGLDRVVVVNGDTPLLPTSTVATFLKEAMDCDMAFMTLTLPDPGAYGRVVRHNRRVVAIVEAKDYDETLYGPEPDEINAGIYCLRMDAVEKLLPRLTNANKSGEYYITDLVGLAVSERMDVIG
ncbi:MAG TPA: bifunctional UDP-N-acetylglucosamine diphosphorylase/glucosamine-1-phosphate N-acetyltransferase GlmU, partial [Desulfovibrio sp.]|nr:bifunctional UDP-N-acetylglucosamine diphosphorylase/glucosamine-1-phosphate N-acetyltransferase GlmU [Desulfovibrio sp.]